MVNALIKINENTNRVLNIIKAKYNLKNKGEAIEFMVNKYIDDEGEPELRPEFIKKIMESEHKKGFKFKSVDELKKRYNEI